LEPDETLVFRNEVKQWLAVAGWPATGLPGRAAAA
jgi:hypothetical protein